MLYIKVLCIICLTIISDNNGYTMEYNETPAPQINNNNKSMNDLANENIELHKRLDLLYEQMEQIQQERKQEKEDKKCEEELKRILKSKEMLPKHEYKLWKPARRLPWEECEPDPMVWQHLLTILNREINEIQEVGRYFYRTFLFINEDMGYYNWYLSYRNPISSDVTNCEEKFKKFDEHLQKILQNIPEDNNKYTNLKDKVLQLIKKSRRI